MNYDFLEFFPFLNESLLKNTTGFIQTNIS